MFLYVSCHPKLLYKIYDWDICIFLCLRVVRRGGGGSFYHSVFIYSTSLMLRIVWLRLRCIWWLHSDQPMPSFLLSHSDAFEHKFRIRQICHSDLISEKYLKALYFLQGSLKLWNGPISRIKKKIVSLVYHSCVEPRTNNRTNKNLWKLK